MILKTNPPPPIKHGTPFYFRKHLFHFGKEILELTDSSEIKMMSMRSMRVSNKMVTSSFVGFIIATKPWLQHTGRSKPFQHVVV